MPTAQELMAARARNTQPVAPTQTFTASKNKPWYQKAGSFLTEYGKAFKDEALNNAMFVLDQVARPGYAITTGLDYSINEAKRGGNPLDVAKSALVGAGKGFVGNDRKFGTDILTDIGWKPQVSQSKWYPWEEAAKAVLGVGIDMAAQPTFGTSSASKLSKIDDVALNKSGRSVLSGLRNSNIDDMLKVAGKTDDLAVISAKADDLAKSQMLARFNNKIPTKLIDRGGVKLLGKTVIPGEAFSPVSKLAGKIKNAYSKSPINDAIGGAFSTKYVPSATQDASLYKKILDAKKASENTAQYLDDFTANKIGEIGKKLNKLQKQKIITPNNFTDLTESIERGGAQVTNNITSVADNIADMSKQYGLFRDSKGFNVIKEPGYTYLPHNAATPKQTLFQKLLKQRDITTKTADDQIRSVMKFTDDAGNSLIGTADDLGLKPSVKVNDWKAKYNNIVKAYDDKISNLEKQKSTIDMYSKSAWNLSSDAIQNADDLAKTENNLMRAIQKSAKIENKIIDLKARKFTTLDKLTKKLQFVDDNPRSFVGGGKKYTATQASIQELSNANFDVEKNPLKLVASMGNKWSKKAAATQFEDDIADLLSDTKFKGSVEITSDALPKLKGKFVEPEIAKLINKTTETLSDPTQINKFMSYVDDVTNTWKAVALMSPGYHTRNVIGNLFNNWLGGVLNPKYYSRAAKIQLAYKSGKLNTTVKIGGRNWKVGDFIDTAKREGSLTDTFFNTDVPIKSQSNLNPLVLNRNIGGALENNAKIAHIISKMDDGLSIKSAVLSSKKYLFDYQDLTDFERTVMKRLFPFYTWTRKNIPLQLANTVTQPGKYVWMPRLSDMLQEKYGEVEGFNEFSVPMPFANEDGKTQYFDISGFIPATDITKGMAPGETMLSSANPILQAALKMIPESGFDTFKMDEIKQFPEQKVNYLGIPTDKKTASLLNMIRPLAELNRLNPPVPGKPEGAFGTRENELPFDKRLLRLMTGIRSYEFDPAKDKEYKLYDLNDRRTKVNSSFRRAVSAGDWALARAYYKDLENLGNEYKALDDDTDPFTNTTKDILTTSVMNKLNKK